MAYFDRLQEKTVWVDQAKERYNAFADLQTLENPIGNETRDARGDLFMSRLERYTGWETPKCMALAQRDYDLITQNMNAGKSFEDAGKCFDGWCERICNLETLKHGDCQDMMKLLLRLREPGESFDETLARTTTAIESLEKHPPYNQFDDLWFFDFKRPIYLGLNFVADGLQDGTLGDLTPKQAFSDLMELLSKSNCIEQINDQVIIDRIKLNIKKMNKIELFVFQRPQPRALYRNVH